MQKLDLDEIRRLSPDSKVWGMAALWNAVVAIATKIRRMLS